MFRLWLMLCDSAKDKKERGCALETLMEYAKTFSDWRNIFYRAERESVFELTVLLQMATLAKTFGNWLNVCLEARNLGELIVEEVALRHLKSLADDPVDADESTNKEAIKLRRWQRIFEIAPCQGKTEQTAAEKVSEQMLEDKCQLAAKQNADQPVKI